MLRDCHSRVNLTGPLADLPVVRRIARIHRGAACAHRSSELVGDRLDGLGEVLGRAQRAAARKDDPRRLTKYLGILLQYGSGLVRPSEQPQKLPLHP